MHLSLVSITRQTPRPRHKNKEIRRLSSHPSRKSLCFDSKLVVVVVVIGLMETRLKQSKITCCHIFLKGYVMLSGGNKGRLKIQDLFFPTPIIQLISYFPLALHYFCHWFDQRVPIPTPWFI